VREQEFVYIRHARREVEFVIVCVVRICGEVFQLPTFGYISGNDARRRAKRDKKHYAENLLHICN
jgi:hypothetical protein